MTADYSRRDFLKNSAMAAGTAAAAGVAATAMGSRAAQAASGGGLKKALQYRMLPGKLSDEEKFALAKDCGFDGIEGGVVEDLDAAKKLGDTAREAGVPIHGIVFGGWHAPFSSPDPAVIEEGLNGMRTALHSAKAQGATTVLLVPAVVNGEVRYVDAYTRSQEHIRKLLPLAEELDVVIAVEFVWNYFLLSPMEFARYVDEFNSPYLQAYFDTGNVVKFGWAEDWIRTLGKRTAKIHLKDYARKTHSWENLREGDVNWPEVRKAMAEAGYNSFLTTELKGGDEAYLRDLSERIDKIIAGV